MQNKQAESARVWTSTLRCAVATGDEAQVASVFSALVWQDAEHIAERSKAFLKEFIPIYVTDESLLPDSLEACLRMDLFGASVLAYLESKEADVELSVEHDIDNWIEANAPAVASANLRLMEEALGQASAETHREVIKLHQLVSLEACERLQYRALQETWSGIEYILSHTLTLIDR